MGSGIQDLTGDVSALQNMGGNSDGPDLVPPANNTGSIPGGGTPPWQTTLQNAVRGAGKGLQTWSANQNGPNAKGGGGGGSGSQVSQPTLPNNFDPNYLLQFLNQGAGGSSKLPAAASSNAFFGG